MSMIEGMLDRIVGGLIAAAGVDPTTALETMPSTVGRKTNWLCPCRYCPACQLRVANYDHPESGDACCAQCGHTWQVPIGAMPAGTHATSQIELEMMELCDADILAASACVR